jgi:hypothetical protein
VLLAGRPDPGQEGRHVGPELFGHLERGPVEDLLRVGERAERADQLGEPRRAGKGRRRDGVRVLHLLAQPPDLAVEFDRVAGLAGVVHPSLSPAVPATT